MRYRRFGRSEARVSVITLGGMRYAVDRSLDEPSPGMITECRESVTDAFASGINLIETAYGYSKSEACYGRVLNDELNVPRGDYYLMTKGSNNTASDTRRSVEEQLTRLKTDHIDFYAWHGMNTAKRQHVACVPKGPIQELLRLKAEGVIGHVGFSTHGAPDVIAKAIDDADPEAIRRALNALAEVDPLDDLGGDQRRDADLTLPCDGDPLRSATKRSPCFIVDREVNNFR